MQYDTDEFTARMPNGERVTLRVKRDIDKLAELDPSERMASFLKMFPSPNRGPRSVFADIFGVAKSAACDDEIDDALDGRDEEDAERERNGDGADTEKRVDHHASTVADLLVEAKSFPHRAAALDHLLHIHRGQALLQRMHKAADTSRKGIQHA